MMGGSKPRKNSSRLIVTVSLPKDLVEILNCCSKFHNRSAMVSEAIEWYLRMYEPTLYGMLTHRREMDLNG